MAETVDDSSRRIAVSRCPRGSFQAQQEIDRRGASGRINIIPVFGRWQRQVLFGRRRGETAVGPLKACKQVVCESAGALQPFVVSGCVVQCEGAQPKQGIVVPTGGGPRQVIEKLVPQSA